MIEINLLPKELRKVKKVTVQIPNIPILPVAAGVLAVLVAVYGGLDVAVLKKKQDLGALDEKWRLMEPQREKTGRIIAEIAANEKKVSAIRKIAKPKLNWTKLLLGLNESIIPNIWIADLGLQAHVHANKKSKDVNCLEIGGYALGNSEQATLLVAKFINNLEENKNFSDYFERIELRNINKREIKDEEVMMFKLDCYMKNREDESLS
ncbi:MAG: hypothetical protein ABIH09_02155 [Candidatus Omnitrophota bacterium]